MLVEIEGCVFDERQLNLSHGYEDLDPIGKEAFVNHTHLDGINREKESEQIIISWSREMKEKWPGSYFKIYRQVERDEIILRFHKVRPGKPDWCDSGIEIIEVKT